MCPSPTIVAVDHDLVAGVQVQQVADDDAGRVDVDELALAHDGRLGPREDRDAVDDALGADLLRQADDRVGQDHGDGHEGVEVASQRDEHHAEGEEEVVDEVEDVLAHDARVRAPGAHVDVVAQPGRAPADDLVLREAGSRRAASARGPGEGRGRGRRRGGRWCPWAGLARVSSAGWADQLAPGPRC